MSRSFKIIFEIIYLSRNVVQGTLQKFVDDLFTVILSTSRPVPLAVKYFFDLLDDQAGQHSISDPETIHIWKTNRYSINPEPERF